MCVCSSLVGIKYGTSILCSRAEIEKDSPGPFPAKPARGASQSRTSAWSVGTLQHGGQDYTCFVFNLQLIWRATLSGQGDHCCLTLPGTVPWGMGVRLFKGGWSFSVCSSKELTSLGLVCWSPPNWDLVMNFVLIWTDFWTDALTWEPSVFCLAPNSMHAWQ